MHVEGGFEDTDWNQGQPSQKTRCSTSRIHRTTKPRILTRHSTSNIQCKDPISSEAEAGVVSGLLLFLRVLMLCEYVLTQITRTSTRPEKSSSDKLPAHRKPRDPISARIRRVGDR